MDIHVCKQCGSHFVYCRACVFRPIRYKDAGFCSKECYEASKNKVEVEVKIEPVIDEVLIEDIQPTKEDVALEVEAETIKVTEPVIKNETENTYKKKKNKYQVRE